MTTWLSAHFSLEELTATSHRDVDNTPPAEVLEALTATAGHMEAVRRLLDGRAILVSSGYRSRKLNRAVGGSPVSAHLKGWAVDFICPRFGPPLEVCRRLTAAHSAGALVFDQVIEEGTWVHISFDPRSRGQVLTKAAAGGYARGLRAA